jgi:hypothetical protein
MEIDPFSETCSFFECLKHGMMTRLQDGDLWFIPGISKRLFDSPKCPDWLWGLPSLLFNDHQGFFSSGGEGT